MRCGSAVADTLCSVANVTYFCLSFVLMQLQTTKGLPSHYTQWRLWRRLDRCWCRWGIDNTSHKARNFWVSLLSHNCWAWQCLRSYRIQGTTAEVALLVYNWMIGLIYSAQYSTGLCCSLLSLFMYCLFVCVSLYSFPVWMLQCLTVLF